MSHRLLSDDDDQFIFFGLFYLERMIVVIYYNDMYKTYLICTNTIKIFVYVLIFCVMQIGIDIRILINPFVNILIFVILFTLIKH